MSDSRPRPLYTIIVGNVAMCVLGFTVSFTRTETEWARITLCALWSALLVFASLNQGRLYPTTLTRLVDILLALALLVMYALLYWTTMKWYHVLSGVCAVLFYGIYSVFFLDESRVNVYIVMTTLWHVWVMVQILLVPYTLPEGL